MPTLSDEPDIANPAPPTGEPPGSDGELGLLISRAVAGDHYREDATVVCLLDDLRRRHGDAIVAVLMYGSYLRGKRDTLLDFYVVLENLRDALPSPWQRLANRLLPPNVYYQCVSHAGGEARAKYATLTLNQFETALRGDFHSYFWSRFTQPCALVYTRDQDGQRRVLRALQSATETFIESILPMLPRCFTSRELWQTGFALTYRTELRAESGDRIAELYEANAGYFDGLCSAYAKLSGSGIERQDQSHFRRLGQPSRAWARLAWLLRRWQGKLLSALRIIKSAGTFDDPLDYLLWKIRRHSGIYIAPTERQRRFPLLFAWPLLWRLYRLGAFR